jgi:hypothetical protein
VYHASNTIPIFYVFEVRHRINARTKCYLPWPIVICLGKCYLPCTATKKAITLCPSCLPPCFLLSPRQLLVLLDSFLPGLAPLSIKSTFCTVSGCFWLSKSPKKRKLCRFCVSLLCFFYSPSLLLLPFDPFLFGLTSLSILSAFCPVSGCLKSQKSELCADIVPCCVS